MNKFATLLVTTAAIAIASPTLAADHMDLKSQASMQQRANGGYEKHAVAEKTTASGHERAETTVTLDVDDNGNKEKVTTTEEVNDPKGLMNKQTVKTQTKEMVKDGKITVESQKKVNGDTVSKTKKSW